MSQSIQLQGRSLRCHTDREGALLIHQLPRGILPFKLKPKLQTETSDLAWQSEYPSEPLLRGVKVQSLLIYVDGIYSACRLCPLVIVLQPVQEERANACVPCQVGEKGAVGEHRWCEVVVGDQGLLDLLDALGHHGHLTQVAIRLTFI